MERLADAAELLDGPLDDSAALRANLRDLRAINRLLGGARLSAAAIEALVPAPAPVSLLDVGTGGADIPVALLARARRRARPMTVVAVDSRAEVLDAARELRPGLDRLAGLELRVADGRVLPFPDEAFDVAHASLVLHHLEPRDAVAFLCELARVSRAGVVVNDLSRGRLHWAAAWALGRTLFRSAYTRHDAPLSVRRAYTAEEMADLLDDANLRPIRRARGLAGHRYAIAAVRR